MGEPRHVKWIGAVCCCWCCFSCVVLLCLDFLWRTTVANASGASNIMTIIALPVATTVPCPNLSIFLTDFFKPSV